MERLADKHFSGKGYYMLCSGVLRCVGNCGECEELEKVVDRLGEYEDKAEQKPKTNADRIRAMSDEELATFVAEKIVNIENQKMIEQGHTPTATQLSALGHTMYCTLMRWLREPAEGG